MGVLIKNKDNDDYTANTWKEFIEYLEKEKPKEEPKKEIPKIQPQEKTLLQPDKPKEENLEKKVTETIEKPKDEHYQKILENKTSNWVIIYKKSGVYKDEDYNLAGEILLIKDSKPGRKIFERTPEGKYNEIPSSTSISYLEKKAEQEPKEESKTQISKPEENKKELENELEKELTALQQSIKEKKEHPSKT